MYTIYTWTSLKWVNVVWRMMPLMWCYVRNGKQRHEMIFICCIVGLQLQSPLEVYAWHWIISSIFIRLAHFSSIWRIGGYWWIWLSVCWAQFWYTNGILIRIFKVIRELSKSIRFFKLSIKSSLNGWNQSKMVQCFFLVLFAESLQETRKMPTAFKIYWALHNIALTTSFVVTIIYWSILYVNR